ncbi:hypothetical protein PVAP13_7NG396950 [Panicum virgatum]|uniref:Uncharacterized protein n=1 Tax=Panicum virgatum TaxID=38727 RepID=A0A8T0Q8A8_PANVG|nr:hypothetical protein PVAP13_7NG396950 [Panicum virgatum]
MLTTPFINLVKDRQLAKEEESLSHTLHNVPVVSKKHLFPQEISLSMPMARAADSSGNLFCFSNQLTFCSCDKRRRQS